MGIIRSESNGHTLVFYDDNEPKERRHTYELDGRIVPGVTDSKKGYPLSEALIRYKIKQGIEEHETGKKLKRAAGIGTHMHNYAHARRLGLPWDDSEIIGHEDEQKIRHRFRMVDGWLAKQTDKVVSAEQIIGFVCEGHRADPNYQGMCLCFAGKYDVLVEREWVGLVLQDYKSSKGFFEDQFIQEGGYALAMEFWTKQVPNAFEVVRFSDADEEPEAFCIDSASGVMDMKRQFLTCRMTREFQHKWGNFFEKRYRKSNPWVKVKK